MRLGVMKRGIAIVCVFIFIFLGAWIYFIRYENKEVNKNIEVPEFSNYILVAYSYGGSGWGSYEETLSAKVTIYKDGRIAAKIEDDPIEYHTIPSENFDRLVSELDLRELYILDPETSEVTDVVGEYLYIYGADDEIIKSVGGQLPQNKDFLRMYRAIMNNIPKDWVENLFDAHIERYLEEYK